MSFGYSVGDLISGANITYKLIRIMADTKGASDEYLQAMAEVSAMQQAFLQVGQIRAHKLLPPATVNATSHIVLSSVDIITKFLDKTKVYQSMLENGSSSGFQTSWYKVGWTLYKAQELKELRDALHSRLMSVQTLLASASYSTPLPSSVAPYRVADQAPEPSSRGSASVSTLPTDDDDDRTDSEEKLTSITEDDTYSSTSHGSLALERRQHHGVGNDSRQFVNFKDAVGRKYKFPWESARHWTGMEELINAAFENVDGLGPPVKEGWYDLISDDGVILLPQVWDKTVMPDMNISMAMWPMSESTDREMGEGHFGRPIESNQEPNARAGRGYGNSGSIKGVNRGDSINTTVQNLSKVANTLCDEENYKQAAAVYRQMMALQPERSTQDIISKLETKQKLVEVLCKQKIYTEAEALQRGIIGQRMKFLDKGHPDTIASMHFLADLLQGQKKHATAEKVYRDALKLNVQKHGKLHPSTLTTMHDLAESLYAQDKLADSEVLHREVLIARKQELGSEHKDTLQSMRNLSFALFDQRKYSESEEVDRELLELRTRTQGEGDPETLGTMLDIAVTLCKQEKYKEAEQLLLLTTQRIVAARGDDDAHADKDMLRTLDQLALALRRQGKVDDAELVYRSVVQRRTEHFGDEDEDTLASMQQLGRLLCEQGRLAEAEKLFRDTLRLRKETLDDDDPDLLSSTRDMVDVLEKLRDDATPAAAAEERNLIAAEAANEQPKEKDALIDEADTIADEMGGVVL